MLSLLKRYTPPIISFKIEIYEHETPLFRFKATILLADESRLHVKEYRFRDGQRKFVMFHHFDNPSFSAERRWLYVTRSPGFCLYGDVN